MDLAVLLAAFGERRRLAFLLLAEHPELDAPDWQGQALLTFGRGSIVKGAVQPHPRELRLPDSHAA